MKCDCHIHIFMDGQHYQKARGRHQSKVDDSCIREHLQEYQKRGITWLRDGGDHYGTSKRAMEIAPEYGITYRTPVFAIHKAGHYGGIVGREFRDMREYRGLIGELRRQGGHFVKIMISGIMDFDRGGLTEDSLTDGEIREMIHIAHQEGFSVMAHTNGDRAALAAIEAGLDSMEHGNFMEEETIRALAQSDTVWVPTVVTVKNLIGDGRFPDAVVKEIWEGQKRRLRLAYRLGAKMALGSDAGAYRVMHGQGLLDEYQAFSEALGEFPGWEARVLLADKKIRKLF